MTEKWNNLQPQRCLIWCLFLNTHFRQPKHFSSSASLLPAFASFPRSLCLTHTQRQTQPEPQLNSISQYPFISNIYRQLEPDGDVCFLLSWQPGQKVFPLRCFPEDGTAAAHSFHSSVCARAWSHTHTQTEGSGTRTWIIGCIHNHYKKHACFLTYSADLKHYLPLLQQCTVRTRTHSACSH